MLTTERLFLIPATSALLDAAVAENPASLSGMLGGVDIAAGWSHFPEALVWMRDFLREHPDQADWWAYFIVHRHDVRLIGTAGYKGPPTPEGDVEIGYEIADAYQGRGLATETAAALVAHARRQPGVRTISAHTLAVENASCAVLRKLGFSVVQEKIDLHDGPVWAWQLGS